MTALISWLDRQFYPGIERNWDDAMFRRLIQSRLRSTDRILDLGAGAGIVKHMDFRGLAMQVCGVDVDPRVIDNPMLDEGLVADAGRIPYPDAAFDLVFADNVMEHIVEPASVLKEVWRVLKPGGIFLFKTPNKTHYMPLIARVTPYWFHQFVNRLRGRASVDTFPTLYRANSKQDVVRFAATCDFELDSLFRVEGRPEYLRFSWITYLFGIAYERTVNRFACLESLRILLLVELRKPL